MKKLILTAIAGTVLCAATFAGYKAHEHQGVSSYSDLTAKNIEALTQGPYGTWYCSTYPMPLICSGTQDYIFGTGYRSYDSSSPSEGTID